MLTGGGRVAASGAIDQTAGRAEESAKRPFRLDDLLDAEEFGSPVFSPDGQAIAFVRRRAVSSQVTNVLEVREARGDVWLQLAPGGEVRNLSKGAGDSSGAWDPRWSPDGAYLSFLSSRGGNVALWVWERRTDAVRQVSSAGIEFRGPSGGCRWVGGRRLMCMAVAEGERSTPMERSGQAVEYATSMWQKVKRGELALSAVDSVEPALATRRLLRMSVDSGDVANVAAIRFETRRKTWWLSPDGRTVAFALPTTARYLSLYRLKLGNPVSLELRTVEGRPVRLDGAVPLDVLGDTLSWTADGHALSFFARGTATINPVLLYGEEFARDVQHERVASVEQPAKLWEIDLRRGRVAQVDTGDIDLGRELLPPSFQYVTSDEWLFRSRRLSDRLQPQRVTALSWWLLGRTGRIRPLLRESSAAFDSLESFDGGRTFLSLTNRDIWQVDVVTGMVRNLTESFAPPILRYDVPQFGQETHVALKAGEPTDELSRYWARYGSNRPIEGSNDYALDVQSGTITPVVKPGPQALLAAFHAPSHTWVYENETRDGLQLWRSSSDKGVPQWERLAIANTYYQAIARYQERLLEYTTAEGAVMTAKVTFPLDYIPGRRYPVVVDSDIDYTPAGVRQLFTLTRDDTPIGYPDGKAFASAGYVYMFVSAPVRGILDDAGRSNMLLLTSGLLPALDAAVAAGFADPERFVLYGISSFGFGVLATVTQTARFKAAVAQSSWVDQGTMSLAVSAVERYSDNPFDGLRPTPPYSTFQLPFWRNGEHYRRNSPLSYVDRVRTPLLLIQHEFDGFPMSQVEMFFSALVLQRKPARFLRYFGEEHGLRMPANVRDCYRQIFAWFDEYADIERDDAGRIVFDGDRTKSRNGRPALKPGDFMRFGPAAEGSFHQTAQPEF